MRSLPRLPGLPFTIALLLLGSLLAGRPAGMQEPAALDAASARAEIGAAYAAWGRARVAYDRETLERMLQPEFHVLLYGQEISREKFLHDISQPRQGSRLVRFDADVLTLRRDGDEWTAVITEKLELEVTGTDGDVRKVCSLWVTRDGWRREDGAWRATYSEAIGHETWPPGEKPPFAGW